MPVLNEYKLGKYKFSFVAPRKTSDARGYYSLKSISGISNDFIRLYFVTRICDTYEKAKVNSISISTWEAIKGKYIVILSDKTKKGYEDTQNELMEDIAKLLQRLYRNSKITIIPVKTEEDIEEQDEQVSNEV